jgi:very-short-patch-repair endonuclease
MKSIFANVLTPEQRRYLKYVGIGRMLKPRRAKYTSLERKYYDMLKELGVFFVPQYRIGRRYYDAYLPDQNILLEFDGSFWHPKTKEDIKYDFQRKNMAVDLKKNRIARDSGHKIIRIREDEPVTKEQFRKIILE